MRHTLATAVTLFSLAATAAAWQAPTVTGQIQLLPAPPGAVYRNYPPLDSDDHISLFQERGPSALCGPADVDITGTGTYDAPGDLDDAGTIPGETSVEVYFLHQDTSPGANTSLSGTITFPRPILGVILLQDSLQQSDATLGWPDTVYPGQPGDTNANPQAGRGVEFDFQEQVSISPDRLQLAVTLYTNQRMDQIRLLIAADSPVSAFCFGESGCPCGNDAAPGSQTGCRNSTGNGARLAYAGGASCISLDNMILEISGLPPGANGLLYMGGSQAQVAFGDGYRCVAPGPPGNPPGTGFLRFPIRNSSSVGVIRETSIAAYATNHFGTAGAITPGSTWYFQGYYRDPHMACNYVNLTNGLSVTFF